MNLTVLKTVDYFFKPRKNKQPQLGQALRVSTPALVESIPGVEMGKMTLEIDARSRKEAKKLGSLIDFKRSIFLVEQQTKRLEAMSQEL